MEFNINSNVKVRLNSEGHRILEEFHHDRLQRLNEASPEFEWGRYKPPETDKEGYSEFQMWHLMEVFGAHVGMAKRPPFEITIIIED